VFSPSSGLLYIGFVAPDTSQPGGGPEDNSTNYFAALPNWTITPGFVPEADIYLIAGDYKAPARSCISYTRVFPHPTSPHPSKIWISPCRGLR